jgi:hypothetical protein
MDVDLKNAFQVSKSIDNLSLKTIEFNYLWHLFKPGSLVLYQQGMRDPAMLRAFTVLHVTGGRISFDTDNRRREYRESIKWDSESESEQQNEALAKCGYHTTTFIIDCVYLDSDGAVLGPRPRRFVIPAYPGEKAITSLEVYPAKFDPNYTTFIESLVARGKRFLSVSQASGSHQRYSGSTIREAHGSKKKGWSHLEINEEQVSLLMIPHLTRHIA